MKVSRGEQEDALVRFVDVCDAIGLHYLLTGSLAASVHGMPRMTRDVDILIDPERDHLRPLQKALSEDFDTDPYVVELALREGSMFNIIDPRSFTKLDVVVRDRRREPDEVMERAVEVELLGRRVRTISLEDLILAKLKWARTSRSVMQLRDVHWLLRQTGLDEAYLGERILKFGLEELVEEARDARYD